VRATENEYDRLILQAISSGERVTQRSLAGRLGVALGLTNLLVRRLVAKGYVRVSGLGTRHVRYLMTAAGWEALGRATRISLQNTVHLYTQTREQIRTSLLAISASCPIDARGHKSVVFYGAGDVAEIAYVSLQNTDLCLVGVVDDRRSGEFFGTSIRRPASLIGDGADALEYSRVVVTSLRDGWTIAKRLRDLGIPPARVAYLMPAVAESEQADELF
jgi:DNA-binding MarR family transcriptional regulator